MLKASAAAAARGPMRAVAASGPKAGPAAEAGDPRILDLLGGGP